MIYPVVKKHSEVVNHYVLPAAVGAGWFKSLHSES